MQEELLPWCFSSNGEEDEREIVEKLFTALCFSLCHSKDCSLFLIQSEQNARVLEVCATGADTAGSSSLSLSVNQ